MLLDLIFLSILLSLAAYGAWRGVVASASGLVALVAGYAGGIFAATHFAGWVGATLVLPSMLAPAVAGSLGFAVVFLLAGAIGDVATAWDRERIEGTARGLGDRVLGGAVGLVRGGLVVVLLAVLTSWLDAARDLGAIEGLAAIPDAGTSSAVAASGDLVEGVVARALSDAGPAGQLAARVAARPGVALEHVQGLVEDERLMQLFEDRLFWTQITSGSIDAAMNRAAMRSIIEDPGMRGQFAELGLVAESARTDPEVFRVAMAGVLAEIAPRVHRLQHDPELNDLARDPEIIALVEAGDMMSLIGHPSIRKLVDRVSGP